MNVSEVNRQLSGIQAQLSRPETMNSISLELIGKLRKLSVFQDDYQNTLLHLACFRGLPGIVYCLTAYKLCEVNAVNSYRETALFSTVRARPKFTSNEKKIQMVKILSEAGIDVFKTNTKSKKASDIASGNVKDEIKRIESIRLEGMIVPDLQSSPKPKSDGEWIKMMKDFVERLPSTQTPPNPDSSSEEDTSSTGPSFDLQESIAQMHWERRQQYLEGFDGEDSAEEARLERYEREETFNVPSWQDDDHSLGFGIAPDEQDGFYSD